jgi:2OG-Fe(II) oxygenase superfamily/WD domain, G-beta repeat
MLTKPLAHGNALTQQSLPWCVLITDFLSKAECAEFIAQSEARGYCRADSDYPPSYRNNARQVVDSVQLAQRMATRLRAYAPATWEHDAQLWNLEGVNERFRFCRYAAGQQFHIHQDGVFHRPASADYARSFLTFMIYLSDGETFGGGDTLFYSQGPGHLYGNGSGNAQPEQTEDPPIVARVRPRAGSLILFDHSLWHAGEMVTSGVKHIMRSDVMYKPLGHPELHTQANESRTVPQPAFQPCHQGYVWALVALPAGKAGEPAMASCGRDRSIRLWSTAGAPLGQLQGHTQSVLGLAVLADGRLASVSRDRTLKIWNIAAGRCDISIVAHHSAVLCVCAFTKNTNLFMATGGACTTVKLWNDTGTLQGELTGHQGWIWAILNIPNSGYLATASEDGCIKIWDTVSGNCIHTLQGNAPLRTLCTSADGCTLIAGDMRGRIVIWRFTNGVWAAAAQLSAHTAAVRRVQVLANGAIATAGEDNYLRIWNQGAVDDASGGVVCEWQLQRQFAHDNFVTDILPTADGCISCAYDGEIRCWVF